MLEFGSSQIVEVDGLGELLLLELCEEDLEVTNFLLGRVVRRFSHLVQVDGVEARVQLHAHVVAEVFRRPGKRLLSLRLLVERVAHALGKLSGLR